MQVDSSHYSFSKYVSIERWLSYWVQLKCINEIPNVKSILLVGVGDGVIVNVLKSYGYHVKTFDLSDDLSPDFVGDISKIDEIVDERFDLIVCCQVLEHLPFSNYSETLSKISKRCTFLILSLPYCHHKMVEFRFKVIKLPCFLLRVLIPKFYKKWKFDGQHYWEVGTKGYSYKKIQHIFKESFKLDKSFIAKENSYHYFLIGKSL